MEPIQIERDGKVLAHHTTETFLSHYGQLVWTIEDASPEPAPVIWKQGHKAIPLHVVELRGGWLVCRQPDGFLCGIIWTDGTYYADLVVDESGEPVQDLKPGCLIRGMVQFDRENPEDLGAILSLWGEQKKFIP